MSRASLRATVSSASAGRCDRQHGGQGALVLVLDMDLAQWSEAIASFPTAGMLATKHAAKAMIAGGRKGSIIHLLSDRGAFRRSRRRGVYAAKAALLSLARSAAMDLAHAGIRCEHHHACAMEHQLWTNMREEMFDPKFVPPQRRGFYSRDDYLKMIPLERFPRASDLAWAAVFLASDESSFLTGVRYPGRWRVAVQVPDLAAGRPQRREYQGLRAEHRAHA
jgi:NAD(P)-dependent dehydrogenase (short-subunit alcohol dehydrogenase family)